MKARVGILDQGFEAQAKSLREFGYPDVTAKMVKEIHDAWIKKTKKLPHGVIGRFCEAAFKDYPQIFGKQP